MTPQQLIDLARTLNPEKLASNPEGALADAYAYNEALLMLAAIPTAATPAARKAVRRYTRKAAGSTNAVSKLKEVKELNGLTAKEVSKQLGISVSALYGWMNGKFKPNREKVAAIDELVESYNVK
jgi:hypothetical protein